MSRPVSLSECIDTLGGTAAVAHACGLARTAVSNWKAAGKVPPRHTIALWAMAKRAGVAWQPPGTEGLDLVVVADAPMARHRDTDAAFTQCSSRKDAAA